MEVSVYQFEYKGRSASIYDLNLGVRVEVNATINSSAKVSFEAALTEEEIVQILQILNGAAERTLNGGDE